VLNLTSSTLASNTATSAASGTPANVAAQGGALFLSGTGQDTLVNDTLWANVATSTGGESAQGGGISDNSSPLTLVNVTDGNNTATGSGGASGGGLFINNSTVEVLNSLFSNPHGPAGQAGADIFGTIADAQNNVFSSLLGVTIINDLGSGAVVQNLASQLGPLQHNRGPAGLKTVALLGTPATDHAIGGGTASSAIADVPTVDERGTRRPGPNGFDVGAFQT
jgi:hypothetical protein